MGHWVRRIFLPNCSGDGRWSSSTKVTARIPIHFHPLDPKPLTTLEQARKLSAHKSGGESWGSMEQNDYLLFNLPLSLQYMSNFVKDWTSFEIRWVTLGWWLAGIAPSRTWGPQKVLGSNLVMCRWNTCWPSGNELDLTWGYQLCLSGRLCFQKQELKRIRVKYAKGM
jgi:hypothetical protein